MKLRLLIVLASIAIFAGCSKSEEKAEEAPAPTADKPVEKVVEPSTAEAPVEVAEPVKVEAPAETPAE